MDRLRIANTALLVIVMVLLGFIAGLYLRQGSFFSHTVAPNGSQNPGSVQDGTSQSTTYLTGIEGQLFPPQGHTLPVKWDTVPEMLVKSGALNVSLIKNALQQDGQPLTRYEQGVLNGTETGNVILNYTDMPFVLYLLWGIGINNNNTIINEGPMTHFGGNVNNLASTAGYAPLGRLSLGQIDLIRMTPAEQNISNYVAENTYRPCCNNPTMFPDCNHGAAALGLIELMAAQGFNQSTIFTGVEEFDVMAFPNQYVTIAEYLGMKGSSWSEMPARTILSSNFSSAAGFSQVQAYVSAHQSGVSVGNGGSSCSA